MTSPAQPTWRDTLSAFAYRHLRLPPPKLETGRFGWATRWFLDWLVPTGASAWAAYHLAAAFVAHYRSVLPANVGPDVPLGVMSELMSLANSKPFAYTGISLVAVLVALMFHRYLTWPAPGRWLNRRKRPVIHALPFMLGFLAGKLLAFAVPALAVAVAAYASEGAIGAIAPLAAPIALLSAAYYFLLYDEVRPPAIVSLSFHRSRQRSAGACAIHQAREPDGAAAVGIGAWRDAHDELRDDVLAIADAAGGMCGQNVFVSHDIDDIAIAIALSIDEAHRSDRQKRSLDAQIDRVLRKWRDRGYASGSLHDAKATRASPGAPEARRADVAFWLPESERIVRHGSVLLKARDGRDVRIVEDPIGSVQADASAVRPRPRRMRTFEFV
ncbi:hypothetical protein [Burkholderia pseudomallei]|uniref:hypothetical protein n=1 Tax=Burkholderia pseudomallei TaxID=28450 RepID=UPI0005728F29|nr:hypothetical protein [Burkholderia pseudomallei]CAJ4358417.1 Uncharacterised protein [Burkholderia pseudomallei]CAJ9399659.1 Uncharacterised protein [Burkholderia pseudomallei]